MKMKPFKAPFLAIQAGNMTIRDSLNTRCKNSHIIKLKALTFKGGRANVKQQANTLWGSGTI